MTAERDVTRLVRSWIREDGHESAGRVLQVVLSRLDSTPQRRSWWPARRISNLNSAYKVVLAAAGVLVAAIVGYNLLPGSTVGPPTASPSPSLAPTAAPATVGPSPTIPPLPAGGALDGTYLVTSNTQTPFQVTVPAGWTVTSGMITKGDFYNERNAVLLRPWIVSHVYSDSCQWQGAMQPVGPSKAELVGALSAQTGREATGPDEVTLGGLPTTRFVLSVPGTFDAGACDDGYLRPFPGANGNEDLAPPMFVGSITEIYVVETGGKATAIQAARYEGSSAADVAELQAVLDSIVFLQ
jgi:hypothetical protein